MMKYVLEVEGQEFGAIWNALMERPARESFAVMGTLKAQVEAQESAAQAKAILAAQAAQSAEPTKSKDVH
jgi:hypothetical protein